MKKAILLCAALTLAASPSFASSLFYSWNNCFGEAGPPAPSATVNFDCSDFSATSSYITFQLSAAQSGIIAISGGIDLSVNGAASLPDFWRMDGGGCNPNGLGIDDARGNTSCTNTGGLPVFGGSGGTSTDAFITAYGSGFGGPNKARILWAVVRPSSAPANLTTARQFVAELNWLDDAAVEAGGTCAGCGAIVSQALNFVVLETAAQGSNGDAVAEVISSGDPGSQPSVCVNAANCDVVPVKNKTWGQLKSLYR